MARIATREVVAIQLEAVVLPACAKRDFAPDSDATFSESPISQEVQQEKFTGTAAGTCLD